MSMPDFGNADPNLLLALSGAMTPDMYMAGGMQAQQPMAMDPTQQYLDAYGGDYLGQAYDLAGQLGGLANPKYAYTNTMKLEDTLADRAIAGAKAGYQVSQDEFGNQLDLEQLDLSRGRYGLQEEAAGRDEMQFRSEFGDRDMDEWILRSKGIDPEQSLAIIMGGDPEAAAQEFNAIGTALNLTDENGAVNPNTTAGQARIYNIFQPYEQAMAQQAQQGAQGPEPMDEGKRWGMLDQDQRAKELYMAQQGTPGAHNPTSGSYYTGADAQQRIAQVQANKKRNAANKAAAGKPKSWRDNPDYKPKEQSSLAKDFGKNKYGMKTYVSALNPPATAMYYGSKFVKENAGDFLRYVSPWH